MEANKEMDQIISKIEALVPVNSIYSIHRAAKVLYHTGMFVPAQNGIVQVHRDLLVICDGPCKPEYFKLQGLINQDNTSPASVTILLHDLAAVQQAFLDQHCFFHEVLRNGGLLYAREGAAESLEIPEFDVAAGQSHKARVWQSRFRRAESLLSGAELSEDPHGVVLAALLSQGMVQLCLAYIADRIGYEPNQLSLKQLFAVCRMIDPSIDEAFPTSRKEDRRLFNILIEADWSLRYRVSACIDATDQGMLLRRCNDWLERVEVRS